MTQASEAWAGADGAAPTAAPTTAPTAESGPTPEPGAGGGPGSTGSGSGRRRPWILAWGRDRRGSSTWRRGWVIAALALLVAVLFGFHGDLPNTVGNLGSLLETFLPWFGLAVPLLLVLALLRRSATALIALLLPTVLWTMLFGGQLSDKSSGKGDFTVLTHNVDADNRDPESTVRLVNGSGAEIVALEELTGAALPAYTSGLAANYPYHAVEGTVGLWSKYPISGTRVVDIRIGWTRAFRTLVATPRARSPSTSRTCPRCGSSSTAGFTAGQRDISAQALGDAIQDEPQGKVLLLGDLNGTMNDRSLAPVTSQLRSAQGSAGSGFGFSWPTQFPMARIDQIMSRGMQPTDSWVLPGDGSDHRAVAAEYRYSR